MILVGTDDGIYRWFEGGPWLTFHSLQGRSIVGLSAPAPGSLVALDDAGRVFESTDNGQNWRTLPGADSPDRITAVTTVGRPATILAGTRSHTILTRPFDRKDPKPGGPLGLLSVPLIKKREHAPHGTHGATALAEAPSAPEGWTACGAIPAEGPGIGAARGFIEAGASLFAIVAGSGLWTSTDRGRHWRRIEPLGRDVHALRSVPGTNGLVAATGDGVRISDDGGITWADRSAGLEGMRHVHSVEVRPDNPSYLLAGVAPSDPDTPGAASRDGLGFALFESKDAGKSWIHVKRGFPARLAYDSIEDMRWDPAAPGYAIISLGSGECWRTRSNGDWWEPISRTTRAARVLCALA